MNIKIFTAIFFALLLTGPAWAAEKVLHADKSFLPTGEVNDRAILGELNKKTGQLRESKATTSGKDLIKQLSRKTCKLNLSKPGNKKLSTAEIVKRYRKGVVVVSGYYKCNRCPKWHSSAASGFMLTKDGVFCTSYHVVENKLEIHDLHATMLHLVGLDHERLTYRYAGRDFRLTDVHGNVVKEILA